MAREWGVEVVGLTPLLGRMARRDADTRRRVRTAMGEIGHRIERTAKQRLVPGRGRRTGYLANSINVSQPTDLSVRVGPSAFYGAFVEFGTGRAGASSGMKVWGGYAYGPSKGMPGQGYMQRAMEFEKPFIRDRLRDVGLKTAAYLAGRV